MSMVEKTPVERAARALFPFLLQAASADVERLPFAERVKVRTEIANEAARAAIAAMREPSEGMVEAAKPFRKGVGEGGNRIFTAMIDQALKEGGG